MQDTEFSKGLSGMIAGIVTLPWGTIAFAVAIIYNLHLLGEWWWKNYWRDIFIRKGWFSPHTRKFSFFKKRRKH